MGSMSLSFFFGWLGWGSWTGFYILMGIILNNSRPWEHIKSGLSPERMEKSLADYVKEVREREKERYS